MKPLRMYLIPLVFFIALITFVLLLSIELQSGLSLLQKILLLGSVIVGVSSAVQGYQAMKALTDDWYGSQENGRRQRFIRRTRKKEEGKVLGQYDKIKKMLTLLPDILYRDALRGFLTIEEQQLLRGGVEQVDRGSALGTIKELRKMNEFEEYLSREYQGYINEGL